MIQFIKENAGWVALVILAISLLFTSSQKFGAIKDTSFFDYFDATTGYKLAGSQFYSSTGLSLPSTANGGIYGTVNSTSTTATAQTLKVSDVQGYDTVILTPNVGADTVTLFASSTASSWLATAGNVQQTCFVNGTTTAGINLTFAGGTGTTLLVASSSVSAVGSAIIGPQKIGCFRFVRGNATATTFDILGAFISFI